MESQKHFQDQYPPGIYPIHADLDISNLPEAAAQANFAFFKLNGDEIYDKPTFIASFTKAANFPDYAQANWDSFEECVRDLEWCSAEGYVVLYENCEPFQRTSPEEWKTALDILSTAVEFWKATPTPMFLFLDANP